MAAQRESGRAPPSATDVPTVACNALADRSTVGSLVVFLTAAGGSIRPLTKVRRDGRRAQPGAHRPLAHFDRIERHDALAPKIGVKGVTGLVGGLAVGLRNPVKTV